MADERDYTQDFVVEGPTLELPGQETAVPAAPVTNGEGAYGAGSGTSYGGLTPQGTVQPAVPGMQQTEIPQAAPPYQTAPYQAAPAAPAAPYQAAPASYQAAPAAQTPNQASPYQAAQAVQSAPYQAASAVQSAPYMQAAAPTMSVPDPFAQASEPQQQPSVTQTVDLSVLTPEEQAQVMAFADRIDVENVSQIMQYGVGTQKKMASFSEQALANVRTQELGEVGDMITNVVKELKGFDAEEEGKGGIFGFFKKQQDKLETMKLNYDKAESNITRISENLEQHQVRLLKDSAMLDKLYAQNLAYYKELTMYVLAGKKALQNVRQNKLPQLELRAKTTGLPEDAQAAKDLDDKCNRFEKKLHDLELTRMISIQTAPQIRLIQNNDTLMVEKIQTTLNNTIPLWKSQMVLALGIAHSSEAAKAQKEVTDVTNELLKKNAEKLHMASVETARESERGIVELETLKKTNADLINTLDEVLKIQREGRQKRQQAESEMAQMEASLKNKLLEIQH